MQRTKRCLAVQFVNETVTEIIEYYNMIIPSNKQLMNGKKNSSSLVAALKSIFLLHLDIPLCEMYLLPFVHSTYIESVKDACEYEFSQLINHEGTYLN
jgi:nitrate reductase gamma subunit